MKATTTLQYPVLWVHGRNTRSEFLFRVVESKAAFVPWFSVPMQQEFQKGFLFTSDGKVFEFEGDSGFLRAPRRYKSVLDNLLIPALFFKTLSGLIYYGPALHEPSSCKPTDGFSEDVVHEVGKYLTETEKKVLAGLLQNSGNAREVIMKIKAWILEGPTQPKRKRCFRL